MIVTLACENDMLAEPKIGPTYDIGIVDVPDVLFKGIKSSISIDDWLEARWREWQEEEPEPDSNSRFVGWLVENHGCREVTDTHHHVFAM